MSKSIHFFEQLVYGQLIDCLYKDKIIEINHKHDGER